MSISFPVWMPNFGLKAGATRFVKRFTGKPLINDPIAVVDEFYGRRTEMSYDLLWSLVKRSPEVFSIVNAITEDILSDGWTLEGGKRNKQKAEAWLEDSFAKQQFTSLVFDMLVTGDGYLFMSKPRASEVKGIIEKVVGMYPDPWEFKSESDVVEDCFKSLDDDDFHARAFQHVASSTLRAHYYTDSGKVKGYTQRVGVHTKDFLPDEIVHFNFLKLDGKVYGFSPMMTIITEVQILLELKDNALNYFRKGGVPNFLFTLEEETPNSPTYKSFVKSLGAFAANQNKWKNLVVTGKVTPHELNRISKDMEFSQLARYVTQVVVMAWGVPAHRLSDLLVEKGIKGTSSEAGYYRKIFHNQDILETYINQFLLKRFNVKLKFNKAGKQDVFRDVNIDQVRTNVVEQRMRMGLLTRDGALEYLDVPDKFRPSEAEGDALIKKNVESGMLNQLKVRNQDAMADTDRAATSKEQQQGAAQNRGNVDQELGNQ